MSGSKFVRNSYAVCTNPRSGSWLLCDGLASTLIAGNPREWFNQAEEREQRSQWSIGYFSKSVYSAYLDHVREQGTSANGIFGIKLHYYQFAELPGKLADIEEYRGVSPSALLPALFPDIKYVWLRRRDKARQAISYYRASNSKEWWVLDEPGRRAAEDAQATFDPLAIERLENILLQNDLGWQRHFAHVTVAPFEIFYEDLATDYQGCILKLLNWLNVAGAKAVCIPAPRLQKQSDARTEEWLSQYIDFKAKKERTAAILPTVLEPPLSPAPAGPAAVDRASAFEGALLESPLFVRSRSAATSFPDSWKRWIGENRLQRVPDESIIDVLIKHGYSHELATAEVTSACSHPYLLAGEQVKQRLDKVLSLMDALHTLAMLSPSATAVERRSNVSRSEFLEKYYSASRPVILQGLMTEWRAMALWTPEYLKEIAGREQVEVMAGRGDDPRFELNAEQHRRTMQFSDYVDLVYSGQVTNDYYLVANNKFFQRPAGRALLGDIDVFPEYLDPGSLKSQVFLWFGPAGTVTPLHHDTSNILMAQVAGRKRIRMIAASQWAHVYNEVGVFSRVDCENPDFERYPEFRKATVLDVTLEPGEVLFMPVGWWHQIRSLDVSIMVSFTNFLFANSYPWPMPGNPR